MCQAGTRWPPPAGAVRRKPSIQAGSACCCFFALLLRSVRDRLRALPSKKHALQVRDGGAGCCGRAGSRRVSTSAAASPPLAARVSAKSEARRAYHKSGCCALLRCATLPPCRMSRSAVPGASACAAPSSAPPPAQQRERLTSTFDAGCSSGTDFSAHLLLCSSPPPSPRPPCLSRTPRPSSRSPSTTMSSSSAVRRRGCAEIWHALTAPAAGVTGLAMGCQLRSMLGETDVRILCVGRGCDTCAAALTPAAASARPASAARGGATHSEQRRAHPHGAVLTPCPAPEQAAISCVSLGTAVAAPGSPLSPADPALLLLLRAAQGLDDVLCAAGRDPDVPAGRGGQVRPDAQNALLHGGLVGALGRGAGPLARLHAPRARRDDARQRGQALGVQGARQRRRRPVAA